ncbi:MAG: DNA-binding response regulator [Chloroflexi bacterium RBG_16_57_8]|nr:MAG: DNA-binding response regulator [Chloroflexi bacterium RBG_16_57_8]
MDKILIVEDDRTLLSVLEYNLTKEGYSVVTASDGADGLEVARRENPDFIILDIMLPKMSGYEVCRILRKEMSAPILMLSARGEETDKVVGLDLGADDYMTKPFSMRELLARVRAGLRRGGTHETEEAHVNLLKGGDIEVDLGRHVATVRGSPLTLTPKEFDLLAFLLKNKGLVFSRDQLLEKIWGYDYAGDTRTVDVHVRWLREKIEAEPARPGLLVTVRGVGYRLEV